MKVAQHLESLIEELKANENVISVSLIGTAATVSKDKYETMNDIDLFVVMQNYGTHEREVRQHDGMSYDITYFDIQDLNKLIVKNNHSWIRILSKAKHLYKKDSIVEAYFALANRIFVSGPDSVQSSEINAYRYQITSGLNDVFNRKDKEIDCLFLSSVFLNELLQHYFKLQNTWVPRPKKILNVLFEDDMILYELVKATLKAEILEDKLRLLDDLVIYILRPYGGKIEAMNRTPFPID
jgi:hypothetical protein